MTGMKDLLGDEPFEAYPEGPGHARGSATSRAAADSVRGKLGPAKEKIVAFLRERGVHGGTYDEIVAGAGLSVPTVCGRMVELVHAGVVRKTERTRSTASGRQAVVYALAECMDR